MGFCRYYEIGLGRTGSRSVCQAARMLGIVSNHGFSHRNQSIKKDAVEKCINGRWDFDIYKVGECIGNISSFHWRMLLKALPESKFILPLRPIDDWLCSWKKQKASHEREIRKILQERINFNQLNRLCHFGMISFDESVWKESYKKHKEEVIDVIEKDRLLVLNVFEESSQELWKKMVKFFEVSGMKKEIKFPHIKKGGKLEFIESKELQE